MEDFNNNIDRLTELVKKGWGKRKLAREFNIHPSKAHRWKVKILKMIKEEEEQTNDELVRLSRTEQKLRDNRRINRKKLRENYRIFNAVEEYNEELISLLKKQTFSNSEISEADESCAVGVIHISDVHFNELVDISNNKYDFNIASKRFKLFAKKIKRYFKGINSVFVAFTGDLMNSDRRLDELLNNAVNRSNASFLAVEILGQFLNDLKQDFNITCGYVSGNESRMSKDVGWSKAMASDNYDATIYNLLKYLHDDINFLENDGKNEFVVNINGLNFLLLHGHGAVKSNIHKSVEQINGRYSAKGIIIDYVIFGHLHSAYIGDRFARCSSMVGANDYSESCLNLTGRASQNLYIVEGGKIDGIKVDLQITEGEQYDISDKLESYNAKSIEKGRKKETVFRVVV